MGASGASIHQRVRKLENAGIISGSYIKINEEKLGYTTHAFIGIFLDKASDNSQAVAMLNKIPEVTSCYYTTGGWSLLIKLTCRDNNHLSALLSDKIQKIPGISRTETYICLKHQIERQIKLWSASLTTDAQCKVNERCQRANGSYHISSGSPFKGIFRCGKLLLTNHIFTSQPSQSSVACIIFNRKGNKAKEFPDQT